jgi:hypothetical protein
MTANEIDNFNELLSHAEINAETEWEMDFTASMRARYRKWHEETYVSAKQLEQLERLADVL